MSEASPKRINVPPKPGDATVEEVTDHVQEILAEETPDNRIVWDSSSHTGRVEGSQKDWRERLKGLVGQIQELGGKGVEWTKEGVKKASNYLGNEWEKGSEKLKRLLSKESVKSKAEQVSAMSTYLKERYKDKTLLEKGKQLGVDLLGLARAYNKLNWKTKLKIAGGFMAASAVLTVTGGSASWLYVPFVGIMAGKRVFGGLSAYTGIEAMLEKQLAKKEMKTGVARSRSAVVTKHLLAAGWGVVIGEGVVGAGIKSAAELIGTGEADIVEKLASLWPHHAAVPVASGTTGTGSSMIPHLVSSVEAPKPSPTFGGPGATLGEASVNVSPVTASELASASIQNGPMLDHPIGVSIDARGEGAGQLLADLKGQLREAGYSATNGPEEVRHLMSTRVQELAREYGLNTMHMGDHLEVNAQGQLVFTHEGISRTLLGHPLGADGHLRTSVPNHHPSASSIETAEETETKELNLGQLDHPGVVNGSEIHPHDIPAAQTLAPSVAPQAPSPTTAELDRLYNPSSFEARASSAPSIEASAGEAVQHIESPSIAVNEITHSSIWDTYQHQGSWRLVDATPDPGSPEAAVRAHIFDVMRESGIGPSPREDLAQYLARASETIADGKSAPAGIFSIQGHFIAHGGDLMARQTLALEYMRLHPGTLAVVENQGGFSTPTNVLAGDGTWVNEKVDLTIAPSALDYTQPPVL